MFHFRFPIKISVVNMIILINDDNKLPFSPVELKKTSVFMLFDTLTHLSLSFSTLSWCLLLPPPLHPSLFPRLSTPQKAGWLGAHPQVSDQPAGAQPRPHRRLQVGRGHVRWHREQVWTPSPTLHAADGSSSGGGPLQCEHRLNLHGRRGE